MSALFTLLLQPKFRALALDGTPLAGGLVYVYDAGTTTPKTSYADTGMASPNTWPVVLDANGQADIWISGPYRVVVTDANGVQQYSADHLFGLAGSYASMPDQDADKLIAWSTADGTLINSGLTLSDIEAAVRAFGTVTMLNGGLVAADVGDGLAGVLTDKIEVGPGIQQSITTIAGVDFTSKKLRLDSVGSTLFIAQNFMTP